jgi:type VI protein secretion system component VasK
METQSLNQPETGFERPEKSRRFRRSWQLMIFNEYGRAVRINHLQRYLIAVGILITVLLLAALCFGGLYAHERSNRLQLQTAYTRIEDKVSSLMSENDALTARLAVLYDQLPQAETEASSENRNPGDETETGTAPAEKAPAPGASAPEDD